MAVPVTKYGKQAYLKMVLSAGDKKPVEIPLESMIAFWIVEDMNSLVPVATTRYKERWSEFSELFPLLGNESLRVDIGYDSNHYKTYEFKYFSYVTSTTNAAESSAKDITITWVDKQFTKLFDYPSIAYFNNSTIANAVSIIANDLPIKIDPTKGLMEVYVPNMTKGVALNRLRMISLSPDDHAFVFYKDNKQFFFISESTLFDKQKKATYVYGGNMAKFKLMGNDRFAFTYPPTEILGYSYDNGSVFEKKIDPIQMAAKKKGATGRMMPFGPETEWSHVSKYAGTRNPEFAQALATVGLEGYIDRSFRCSFTGQGNADLSIGDMVEVKMGSAYKEGGSFNWVVSGNWVAEKVVHYFGAHQFLTKLQLMKPTAEDLDRRFVI